MGIFTSNDGVDYNEALKKVESEIQKVSNAAGDKKGQISSLVENEEIKGDEENDELYNQVMDDIKLTEYEQEYNEVIHLMSTICRQIVWNNNPSNKDRKIRINEQEIIDLCPRIWALSVDYDNQNQTDKDKCFLQTLMKGTFSLLGVKSPLCSLKLSACNIQLFFKIFDQIIKRQKEPSSLYI